ncbi:hypothetical protein TMPK1_03910 [Rhodospirillales bacterium TMPK1]|uniref:Uncharacterized protein n=1 Tax=Roseiterribacter gracilis TaxID=2812848 RepID=A0A8S8X782_9PROT|nr:hypothetical protein TMPK1_03910 [Rhodospirillales bacterium TMPK1]
MSLLAGCAAQKRQAEIDHYQQVQAQLRAIGEQCAAELQESKYDPIRDKIELRRGVVSTEAVPFALLVNEKTPTATEKAALSAWATQRETCLAQTWHVQRGSPPPGWSAEAWRRWGSFIDSSVQQTTVLAAALYNGKITYAEFAKQRGEATAAAGTAQQSWVEATRIADQQRRLQEQQLAEQRYANWELSYANFLRAKGFTCVTAGGTTSCR